MQGKNDADNNVVSGMYLDNGRCWSNKTFLKNHHVITNSGRLKIDQKSAIFM